MGRRTSGSAAGRLRRGGVRISGGPWSLFAQKATTRERRLILSLGRAAGGAVTRSRIRRIAREVFNTSGGGFADADLLLLARADVSCEAKRQIRGSLAGLAKRAAIALAHREAEGGTRG